MASILIIEDNKGLLTVLEDTLKNQGMDVTTVQNGDQAIKMLEKGRFDVVISDMRLPQKSGMEILEYVKQELPETPVVLMTAFAEVETAIKALKMGAEEYLIKPFSIHEFEIVVNKCLDLQRLKREYSLYKTEFQKSLKKFIGNSEVMKNTFRTIQRVAQTDAVVLVTGESGTGKELVASSIHNNSRRNKGPFVKVNCASLPETLLESELFGHEKGAFTGAEQRRIGRFELAEGGTIFLDEIGEIPLSSQTKLLRVLQEKEFERIGGNRVLPVNVRVVAATNKDLQKGIKEGVFREDLYYRINVIPIELSPLREKKDDIPLLVQHFILEICVKMKIQPLKIEKDALEALMEYSWPGNIRELRNVIERMIVLSSAPTLTLLDLPVDIIQAPGNQKSDTLQISMDDEEGLVEKIEKYEKTLIKGAYQNCNGIQVKTAEKLKIKRTALQYKLKKYQIEKI
ncbi:sigma-54-dependent transcriptional regulator [Candidatus Riflebacteria bacterium]